jgi:hypothetical protein
MEKIVTTLGERFVREADHLVARRGTPILWLELIEPMIERCHERAEVVDRFQRHESIPLQEKPQPREAVEERPPDDWSSEGTPLPAATREQLREIVGPAVDVARVHTDEHADAVARKERADAVTIGPEMYFRAHTYSPDDPAGLGLIAHEVTHVAEWTRPSAAWHRATDAGVRAEERVARQHERSAIHVPISPLLSRLPSVVRPHASTPRTVSAPATTQATAGRPMKADIDRAPIDAPAPPAQANPNLEMMRRTLFRDLMNQIRVEFERGS